MSQKRKRLSGPEKLTIVKRYLVDRVPISDLCVRFGCASANARGWSIGGQNPNLRTGVIHGGRSQWSGHSFQFHFDAAMTAPFWKKVVEASGMATVA